MGKKTFIGKAAAMGIVAGIILQAGASTIGHQVAPSGIYPPSPDVGRARLVSIAKEVAPRDWRLLVAIMKVESNFDHKAISPKGAIGAGQIMPGVWAPTLIRENIIRHPIEIRTDPKAHVRSVHFILTHYRKTRSLKAALAQYSGGARGYYGKVMAAYHKEKEVNR